MSFALALHLLAALFWVGGMLTMLLIVRPTAVSLLEPPLRLRFMSDALGRFFPWVTGAVVLLPLTGYLLLFTVFGGITTAPLYLDLMQVFGWAMIFVFIWIRLRLFPDLKRALVEQQSPRAAQVLERIRKLVLLNTVLGAVVVLLAGGGRYWG